MILYPVLLRQNTKLDKKLKSVILSDIRIVNMKARWEKPIRKATKKPSGRKKVSRAQASAH